MSNPYQQAQAQQNPEGQPQDSALSRYAAMRGLREHLYMQHPGRYAMSDFVEDLPGSVKPYAAPFGDVLPSLATISHDPNERSRQIGDAMYRLRHSHEDKRTRWKQTLRNAVTGGLAALPFAAAAGLARHGLKWNGMGALKNFKSPVGLEPMSNWTTPTGRSELWNTLRDEGVSNAAFGAAAAGIPTYLAAKRKMTDSDMNAAGQMLQQNPYLTSLPTGDLISAIDYNKPQSRLKKVIKETLMGAGIGAAGGMLGQFAIAGSRLPGTFLKAQATKTPMNFSYAKEPIQRSTLTHAALGMGGAGAVTGGLIGATTPINYDQTSNV